MHIDESIHKKWKPNTDHRLTTMASNTVLRCLKSRAKGCQGIPGVKALVRWATGERLTIRLPKLSLITLSPPLNSGILGLRMGPYVPTPKFFTTCGDPGRVIRLLT